MPYISSAASGRGDAAHAKPAVAAFVPHALHPKEATQFMHRLKTYVVEDSQVIRENLIATLEELAPVEVIGTAEDEGTAVHWLTRPGNHFELVIVDIFLRGGSGLGVLRALHKAGPEHKVVVLSNYATHDMRIKCAELGADKVFDKSNEIDALILYCQRLADGDTGNSGHGALV
jgi:DNA-binding NarL/FixJ family response regulator